jgi:uncharacterized Rossmann fold enzyme
MGQISKVQWFVLEPGDMFYMGDDPTKNVFTFLGRHFTDNQQFVFLARKVGSTDVDLSAFTDKHEARMWVEVVE